MQNHHGKNLTSGHYTSDVLYKNEWYHADDSRITKIKQLKIDTTGAYLLFYVQETKAVTKGQKRAAAEADDDRPAIGVKRGQTHIEAIKASKGTAGGAFSLGTAAKHLYGLVPSFFSFKPVAFEQPSGTDDMETDSFRSFADIHIASSPTQPSSMFIDNDLIRSSVQETQMEDQAPEPRAQCSSAEVLILPKPAIDIKSEVPRLPVRSPAEPIIVLDAEPEHKIMPRSAKPVKKIVVRKYGRKKGGEAVDMPSSLEDLLMFGGNRLGIKAVAVRTTDGDEARIRDLDVLESCERVFLLTEDEEKEFE